MDDEGAGFHHHFAEVRRVARAEIAAGHPIADHMCEMRAAYAEMFLNRRPVFLHGGGNHVKHPALVGELAFVVPVHRQQHRSDPLSCTAALLCDCPHLLLQLAQNLAADRVIDGAFGWKKPVDICAGHAQRLGNIGNRGFGIAQPAEQSLSDRADAVPGLIL